ncbi:MAG: HU family DNA-binding protein [bacterium]|jgi:nucleoid DNA-binding protein|nr:HU family DNA-binding protein [bacterium]MDD3968220.1 HU family DNA-binding protein [Proteiniphilum sp.]MDD4459748.1 HU family DNA-binding protein [Proteiniphilum sp.]
MTHDETISSLAGRLGWPEAKVNELLQAAVEMIGDHLSEPGSLPLPGLGELISSKQREHILLDPVTGERHLMPPAMVLFFRVDLQHTKDDRIAALLKKRLPEISTDDAARLIIEWCGLVRKSLLQEETVESLPFGRFDCKPVTVGDPAIAAVEEGAAGYFRITFTPSVGLQRSVNTLFAHFEPTLLNEGVTFDELSTVTLGAVGDAAPDGNLIARALSDEKGELLEEEPLEKPSLEEPLPDEPSPLPVGFPLRRKPAYRRRKKPSLWLPVIGGVAIVVAGLFFFHRDHKEQ